MWQAYRERILNSNPKLRDANTQVIIGAVVFLEQLQKAYDAGRDDALAPIRDIPTPDFLSDLMGHFN